MPKIMDDSNWQGEMDARTLVEAMEIKKDSKRVEAAKAAATRKVKEAVEVVRVLSSDRPQAETGFRRIPMSSVKES